MKLTKMSNNNNNNNNALTLAHSLSVVCLALELSEDPFVDTVVWKCLSLKREGGPEARAASTCSLHGGCSVLLRNTSTKDKHLEELDISWLSPG